jgi:putative ATP-dependent endonuclease of OLD family
MQSLQQKVGEPRPDSQKIQVIVTTHSPNLASAIDLDNLVLLDDAKAFPLASGHTQLSGSDYGFLKRFLDVTKANMFFARGLVIVEGDAENILLPTLARLIGRDFTANGVSIVNVGGTGLRRFARIFQRKLPEQDGTINVPVACVADFDVMPDCAPEIIGKVGPSNDWPEKSKRRWRAKRDFGKDELEQHRCGICAKASGQRVETFVADQWTLEYDLAYHGLAKEVWVAAHLAKADERIDAGKTTRKAVVGDAVRSFGDLTGQGLDQEELASHVYALFARDSTASKATSAQYLALILETKLAKGKLSPASLRSALPLYLVSAIDHVTLGDGADDHAGDEPAPTGKEAAGE